MAKKKKSPWAGWNPVAPGPLPPKYQNLLNSFLNQQVNAYAQPRQNAITGYTKAFAGELGRIAPQIGQAYSQAQGAQSSLDTALANRLQQQGQETAGGLEQALGAAGQSTLPAALTAQQAVGVGNASFAQGSASLSQLLGQGAAAQAYGAKLPGIAALGGLQATKQLQAQGQSMIPDLKNQFLANELQKWISRTGLGMDKAQLKEQKRQANIQHQEFLANLNLENQKFIQGAFQDQVKQAQQAGKQAQEQKAAKFKAIDGALSSAISAAEKWQDGSGGGGLTGEGGGGLSWSQAYKRVQDRLQHKLGTWNLPGSKLRKLTVYVLRQAGYKVPQGFNTGPAGHVGGDQLPH